MSASAHRVSVLFALAARGALAVAQNPNEVDPARRAYEEGVAHLEAARDQEAALALEHSCARRPVPVALYNLALAWRGLGRYRAAVGLFDRYLQSPDPAATPERLDAIRAEREELLRALDCNDANFNECDVGFRCVRLRQVEPGSHQARSRFLGV